MLSSVSLSWNTPNWSRPTKETYERNKYTSQKTCKKTYELCWAVRPWVETPHTGRATQTCPKRRTQEIYAHQKRRENETFDGVATISMLLKIIDLFCKKALLQRNSILPKRPMILRSLLIVATQWLYLAVSPCRETLRTNQRVSRVSFWIGTLVSFYTCVAIETATESATETAKNILRVPCHAPRHSGHSQLAPLQNRPLLKFLKKSVSGDSTWYF